MSIEAILNLEPLTGEAFEPFGVVVDFSESQRPAMQPERINEGHTLKFADLLPFDCEHEGGRVALHLYRSAGRELPLTIRGLERHPLGSQAFWPLQDRAYVVIVAPPGPAPDPGRIRAFRASGTQAIQYHRGTWHHYQVSLGADADYLVLDRAGPGNNCDEIELSRPIVIDL